MVITTVVDIVVANVVASVVLSVVLVWLPVFLQDVVAHAVATTVSMMKFTHHYFSFRPSGPSCRQFQPWGAFRPRSCGREWERRPREHVRRISCRRSEAAVWRGCKPTTHQGGCAGCTRSRKNVNSQGKKILLLEWMGSNCRIPHPHMKVTKVVKIAKYVCEHGHCKVRVPYSHSVLQNNPTGVSFY